MAVVTEEVLGLKFIVLAIMEKLLDVAVVYVSDKIHELDVMINCESSGVYT